MNIKESELRIRFIYYYSNSNHENV